MHNFLKMRAWRNNLCAIPLGRARAGSLFEGCPDVDPDNPMSVRRVRLSGEVGSPIDFHGGCRFAPRCLMARERL